MCSSGNLCEAGLRRLSDKSDAFAVLDAIGRGETVEHPGDQRWIEAFKTVLWVVQTQDGLALTSEGHQARHDMALQRRNP